MEIDGFTFGAAACSPEWVQKPLMEINMALSFLPSLWPLAFSSEDPRMGRNTKEIIWKQCPGTNEPGRSVVLQEPHDAQSIFFEASSPLKSLHFRTFPSCHFFPEPIILKEQAWFISGPWKQASHSCLLRSLKTSLPGKQKWEVLLTSVPERSTRGKTNPVWDSGFQVKRVFVRDT